MSTRRPRIKAVASLPVRRKNVDTKAPPPSPLPKKTENDSQANTQNSNVNIGSPAKLALETCATRNIVASPHAQIEADTSNLSAITSDVSTKSVLMSPLPAANPTHNVSVAPATSTADERSGHLTDPTHEYQHARIDRSSERTNNRNCSSPTKVRSSPRLEAMSLTSRSNVHHGLITNVLFSPGSSHHIPQTYKKMHVSPVPIIKSPKGRAVPELCPAPCSTYSAPEVTARPDSPAAMVDGIVPLATARSRTVDLLKSEIISESAEVLFDPIVPLPSPSKLRHKLRPVPRLATARRSSVQGSASESEDEHRRVTACAGPMGVSASAGVGAGVGRTRHDSQSSHSTHHSQQPHIRESGRTRNDSVCSAVNHAASALPALPGSPLKEKQLTSRWKRGESSRQLTALRRKQRARGADVQRDQLTMYDLIFYNPSTNPIVASEAEKLAKVDAAGVATQAQGGSEDDPPAPPTPPPPAPAPPAAPPGPGDGGEGDAAAVEAEAEPVPVPQIKLGPNGEIIIDEQSLVIEQTERADRRLSSSVVQEWGGGDGGGGGRYNRAPRTKQWTDAETVRFYRALAAVGTDFSLMLPLFPDRSRRDLKMKFKKEERLNGAQIDKALTARINFNVEELAAQFSRERRDAIDEEARQNVELRQQVRLEKEQVKKARQLGVRIGKGSRSVVGILPDKPLSSLVVSADDIIEENLAPPRKRKASAAAVAAAAAPAATPPPPPPPPGRGVAQAYELPADVSPLAVTRNVAPGSLVCLTIPDPRRPGAKVLQTYVADAGGKLTPINLPAAVLSSVVDYMKAGGGGSPSPHALRSPAAAAAAGAGGGSPLTSASTAGRVRHNSYTITNL